MGSHYQQARSISYIITSLQLIDLKTQLTKSAFNVFYNKHILNNDIKTLDDKTKIILNYYIDKGFMKKSPK